MMTIQDRLRDLNITTSLDEMGTLESLEKDYEEILDLYKQEGVKLAKLEQAHLKLRRQEREMKALSIGGNKEAIAKLVKIQETYPELNEEIEAARREETQLKVSLNSLKQLVQTAREGTQFLHNSNYQTPISGFGPLGSPLTNPPHSGQWNNHVPNARPISLP